MMLYNNIMLYIEKLIQLWSRKIYRIIRGWKREQEGGSRAKEEGEREGREGERATDVSRTYIPFMLLEHAFLAKRNSRGTVRKIGLITARPPCGSLDPRREQYGSRFIAERLVNKAPISALFRLSAWFAARISRLWASRSEADNRARD